MEQVSDLICTFMINAAWVFFKKSHEVICNTSKNMCFLTYDTLHELSVKNVLYNCYIFIPSDIVFVLHV